jgi:putative transposase
MPSNFLTETQWETIYTFLKTLPGLYLGQEAKVRRFVEAVLWLTRTGSPWRALPKAYGRWNSVYKRFARWDERGVWTALFQQVSAHPDLDWLLMDSTTIRAHPCAAGAEKKTVDKPPRRSAAALAGLVPRFTS